MRIAALLSVLLLLACRQPVHTPPNPLAEARARVLLEQVAFWQDTVPIVKFRPPFAYGYWRLEVETCSGKTREGWPTFYQAATMPLREDGAWAVYDHTANAVIFGLGVADISWLIRHELLHFLLSPDLGHPPEYFDADEGKCAALVNPPKPGS